MSSFATIQAEVEALYVGYFMRAGDPGGTQFWINAFQSGAVNLAGAAADFSDSARSRGGLSLSRNRQPRRSRDGTWRIHLH